LIHHIQLRYIFKKKKSFKNLKINSTVYLKEK
jgi:hypothetical protein